MQRGTGCNRLPPINLKNSAPRLHRADEVWVGGYGKPVLDEAIQGAAAATAPESGQIPKASTVLKAILLVPARAMISAWPVRTRPGSASLVGRSNRTRWRKLGPALGGTRDAMRRYGPISRREDGLPDPRTGPAIKTQM